jgi:hypothetical protein
MHTITLNVDTLKRKGITGHHQRVSDNMYVLLTTESGNIFESAIPGHPLHKL